jgi:phosphotriesterase-related protein
MADVNTVVGTIDSSELGFTLMHEHVVTSSAGIPHTFPELVDRERTIGLAIERLKEAIEEGVQSYVDVTTMDLGRDVTLLREVAQKSQVHIIAATGIWLDIPRFIARVTPDQLAKVFTREIEVGIEGTGVKAGVIKVATSDEGVTPANEIVLRAAARTSKRTGVPISTHTAALAQVGNDQISIFEDEGVDLRRVYIGHSNDTDDLDYLAGLARKGCLLGMDHFPGGRAGGLDWEERVEVIRQLVEMGLADKTCLSHDDALSFNGTPEEAAERRAYNPDSISFISRKVLPRLRALGIREEAISTMTVGAPRRYFEAK